jgi:cytochrome c oxidase cbb3-type subunit 1
MFLVLTAGGLVEGFLALQLAPRESILEVMRPFWLARALAGLAILAGFTCLAVNAVMTATASRARHQDTDYEGYEELPDREEVRVGAV